MEQTNKGKFTVGYHRRKLNVLPSTYKLPLIACYQLIVNWLLGIVFDNVPPLWTLSYKEVKHIKNGMIMWNMMERSMYEIKRVYIYRVCSKYKIKYWYLMSAVNVCDDVQNDFNIKYMANNKYIKTQ